MSVLEPVIQYINGETRRIYLASGVDEYYPINDLYIEYRNLRRNNESLRKWLPLLKAEGAIPKGSGAYTPRYVVLLEGTKIVPFDEALQLNQLGDMITDNPDVDPLLYDISELTTAKPIFIKPSESEIIQLNLESIQYSSYDGGISVDVINGISGINYPSGTQEHPVDNLADAITIANIKGFKTLFIRENIIIDNNSILNEFTLIGRSQVNTMIDIHENAVCDNITISNANINGTLDGGTSIHDCYVGSINYVNGNIHNSGMYGLINLDGNKDAVITDCYTVDLESPFIIDMGGSGQHLIISKYGGTVVIRNFNDPHGKLGIGLSYGMIIIDPSITAGNITISGIGILEDYSDGTVTIQTDGLINKNLIAETVSETYQDVIYLDLTSGYSGIDAPIGTQNYPVNNLADAISLCDLYLIKQLDIESDITLTQSIANHKIIGRNNKAINLNGQNIDGCRFIDCNIIGICGGTALCTMEKCNINYVQNFAGTMESCFFTTEYPNTMRSASLVIINDCRSGIPGSASPVIDLTGSDIQLNMRAYSGGIRFINSTSVLNVATVEFIAGKFNFGSDNTAGNFHIRGTIDPTGIIHNTGATVLLNGLSIEEGSIDSRLTKISQQVDDCTVLGMTKYEMV